jgi:hypothetical protein
VSSTERAGRRGAGAGAGGFILRGERRIRRRFPIRLDVRFTAALRRRVSVDGVGRVLDISSQGIAFETSTALLAGMSIRAELNWPVALNGDCPLRMCVNGHVVRASAGMAVMSIGKYEFRTGARANGRTPLDALARQLPHAPKET